MRGGWARGGETVHFIHSFSIADNVVKAKKHEGNLECAKFINVGTEAFRRTLGARINFAVSLNHKFIRGALESSRSGLSTGTTSSRCFTFNSWSTSLSTSLSGLNDKYREPPSPQRLQLFARCVGRVFFQGSAPSHTRVSIATPHPSARVGPVVRIRKSGRRYRKVARTKVELIAR